jgi:hypothetical protein
MLEFNEMLTAERDQARESDEVDKLRDLLNSRGLNHNYQDHGHLETVSIDLCAHGRQLMVNFLNNLADIENQALSLGLEVQFMPSPERNYHSRMTFTNYKN